MSQKGACTKNTVNIKNIVDIAKTTVTVTAIFLILTVFFTACGQNQRQTEPENQPSQEAGEADKSKEQLQAIEDNVERIMEALNAPAILSEESKKQGQRNTGQNKQQGGQSDGQQQANAQDGQSAGQQQGSAQGGQSTGQQQADVWEEITPVIHNLHYQWNGYVTQVQKIGTDRALIDNFGTALNALTNAASKKARADTLIAASQLYAYIPDFYSLYKTGSSSEIKRLRHYTRNAMLNAMTANWVQADSDMNTLKSIWSFYKNTLPDAYSNDVGKLDFSIYEMDKVIKEKNQLLSDIKGRVLMSNIESMEKAMEKENEGGKRQQTAER